MKRLTALLIVLAGFASGGLTGYTARGYFRPAVPAAAKVTLPAEVKVRPGGLAVVSATTEAADVGWVNPDGLELIPSALLRSSKAVVAVAGKPGVYRLYAYTAAPEPAALCRVLVEGEPSPTPPGPTPTPPGPTPPKPIPVPVTGLRVLFVYESAAALSREQLNVVYSSKVREYLNRKCAKDDGRPGWRHYDKDVNVEHETDVQKKLWAAVKPQLGTLPQIAIAVDHKIDLLPLPATEKDALELLQRYGGN